MSFYYKTRHGLPFITDVSGYIAIISKKDKNCILFDYKFEDYNPEKVDINKLHGVSFSMINTALKTSGYKANEVDIYFMNREKYEAISKKTYVEYKAENDDGTIQCKVIMNPTSLGVGGMLMN